MKDIKSTEQLQELCDDFLTSITERKNGAIEVRTGKTYANTDYGIDYIVAYSDEKRHGFIRDGEYMIKTGKERWYDSVNYWLAPSGNVYFWLNGDDCLWTEEDDLKFRFNGYKYNTNSTNNHDDIESRKLLFDLKSKLEELFK